MKNKVIYGINFIGASVMAYSFSLWFGFIYLNLTGHAKGYSYDLGAEKDVSIFLGCVELLIWLVLAIPSYIYLVKKTYSKGRAYVLLLVGFHIALAVIGVLIMFGSWAVYVKAVFYVQV